MKLEHYEYSQLIWSFVESFVAVRHAILQDFANKANEYDVDCSADGVAGCADERAARRAEIEAWKNRSDNWTLSGLAEGPDALSN